MGQFMHSACANCLCCSRGGLGPRGVTIGNQMILSAIARGNFVGVHRASAIWNLLKMVLVYFKLQAKNHVITC